MIYRIFTLLVFSFLISCSNTTKIGNEFKQVNFSKDISNDNIDPIMKLQLYPAEAINADDYISKTAVLPGFTGVLFYLKENLYYPLEEKMLSTFKLTKEECFNLALSNIKTELDLNVLQKISLNDSEDFYYIEGEDSFCGSKLLKDSFFSNFKNDSTFIIGLPSNSSLFIMPVFKSLSDINIKPFFNVIYQYYYDSKDVKTLKMLYYDGSNFRSITPLMDMENNSVEFIFSD